MITVDSLVGQSRQIYLEIAFHLFALLSIKFISKANSSKNIWYAVIRHNSTHTYVQSNGTSLEDILIRSFSQSWCWPSPKGLDYCVFSFDLPNTLHLFRAQGKCYYVSREILIPGQLARMKSRFPYIWAGNRSYIHLVKGWRNILKEKSVGRYKLPLFS